MILGFAIAALLFSFITATFSILAYAEVLGMKKSTHRIEYTPIEVPTSEKEQKEDQRQQGTAGP